MQTILHLQKKPLFFTIFAAIKKTTMEVSAELIAQHFKGEIIGDPKVKVSSVAKIESGKPNNICFLANPKYQHYLLTSKAGIVIVNKSLVPQEKVAPTLIVVDDAYQAVASLLDLLNSLKKSKKSGRAFLSFMAWSAKRGKGSYLGRFSYLGKHSKIGKGTQVYPQVYIGNDVTVGDDVILYPGVKIYDGCKIGNNCILHGNVVIGSDGFGFAPTPDGSYKKIPQTGIVILEDDVEIGSNTVVDRATMGATVVHKGVKLDNLIQIAHNVEIGDNTVMAAQSGVAGSSKVGKQCMIGGQVGISGHITVADGARIAAQAGVQGSIKEEEGKKGVMGSPAFDYRTFMKCYAIFKSLSNKK
jgi:UDP-3-O-[3-hydroxymyristoyl] glucosamine N-acyltransferase